MTEQNKKKKSILIRLIDKVAEIFLPLINLLSAAGIIKGLLTIALAAGILTDTNATYIIVNTIADSVFYFLPVFLAGSTAKSIGSNPYTAMVIGAMTLHPVITEIFAQGEGLSLGIIPIPPVTYHSSIIPAILAAILLKYTEKLFKRFIPELIKGFMTPLLCILVAGVAILALFGPLGTIVGDVLSAGYFHVYNWNKTIAGILLGGSMQILVIFGFHWSFLLIAMNNVAVNGYDTILTLIGPSVFGQAGAAIAVGIKSKDKSFRTICFSAAISACFGITEPAMFGITLPLKTPLIAACIGGAIGGGMAGMAGARAMSFALPSIATLPVFMGEGFVMFAAGCMTAFIAGFVITLLTHRISGDELEKV